MKITKAQIRRIILEELDCVLSEGPLDKFLKKRKIKKQGGHEWDDFSSEQKDALRRAMDLEDPDMTKADLEFAKKQAREKAQTDLETFKQERDAKQKAEEEARRKTQERVEYLKKMFVPDFVSPHVREKYTMKDWAGELAMSYGLAALAGAFTSFISFAAMLGLEEEGVIDTTAYSEHARTWSPNFKDRYMKRAQEPQRVAWEKRIGPIAIEVEKMPKEEIYEKIKYIKPKHSKPIPELYKKALAEQISEMSVTEIEQALKDELTIKKAFKEFEINPAEDLKIKKDDSIYKEGIKKNENNRNKIKTNNKRRNGTS